MKWIGILLLLIVGGCAVVANATHDCGSHFTSTSRARGCVSNQSSIDKSVGVWESQYIAIPMDRDSWLELDTRGRITRVSDSLRELMEKGRIDPRVRLAPGGEVLYDFSRDVNIFRCPSRVMQLAHDGLDTHPESHYRFISSPEVQPVLDGRKRGVICLLHHDVGPRDAPVAVHRNRP